MTNCPTCESARIYPSRLRSGIERVRRALTEHQPYRCRVCGFRGWGQILVPRSSEDTDAEELRSGGTAQPITPDDLEKLDNAD